MERYIFKDKKIVLTKEEAGLVYKLELSEKIKDLLDEYLESVFSTYGENYSEFNPLTKKKEDRNYLVQTVQKILADPEKTYEYALYFKNAVINTLCYKGLYFDTFEKATKTFIKNNASSDFSINRNGQEIVLTNEEIEAIRNTK